MKDKPEPAEIIEAELVAIRRLLQEILMVLKRIENKPLPPPSPLRGSYNVK